ncbi:MAG TPA: trehalase family glycosidase [Bacteroidota bacterium]
MKSDAADSTRAFDILSLLKRTDKHFLGGGNRLIWAPPFPLFLDSPGFWDTAHYFNIEFQPVYTWTLLDDAGREIALSLKERTWDPSALTQVYAGRLGSTALTVTEEKAILEDDVIVCQVTISGQLRRKAAVHFVAWTIQEHEPADKRTWLSDIGFDDGMLRFRKHVAQHGDPAQVLSWEMLFALNTGIQSYAVNLSESSPFQPSWRFTPFLESFAHGRLPSEVCLDGVTRSGAVYLGLHAALTVDGAGPQVVAAALAAAPVHDSARASIWPVLQSGEPIEASRIRWRHYFRTVPHFTCSDEFVTRYYWYRWYGLHINTINVVEGNYQHPFVCEGVGYFRAAISYSAVCHMLENRWLDDPALAQGALLTFLDNRREDGAFRGYISPYGYQQASFYHADWGNALLQLHAVHPSLKFLSEAYRGLSDYARYFDRERDDEVSGLYDIDNHYETGQEYMHRYLAVSPEADRDNWGKVFRLKGVDATVYLYRLKRALALAARLLGKSDEADLWDLEAGATRDAVRTTMWDPAQEMFFDVDPATGARTGVKAATCFYPYFTDIVTEEHLAGFKRHLLSPAEFWTRYPVPSSSADDPYFSAAPNWKGKRMHCPWNGRVWPMTNSHIAEALAAAAVRFKDPELLRATTHFILTFIKMMFFDGNPKRPNCFEHYNPLQGTPSLYRGVDDYQHSWVADLMLKYICGIRPEPDGRVMIDPFPFGMKEAAVSDVHVRGHRIDVSIKGHAFQVRLDKEEAGTSKIGKAVELKL